jgi:exopolysaccharide biosynthesis WecB/TagA/CpsF family protein
LSVSALAVHGVMTGVQDREHRARLNSLDIVTPDGQPVRWALNLLHGAGLRDRVYGPLLSVRILAMAERAGLPVYFYGSSEAVIQRLYASLRDRFPELPIAGCEPSRFRRLSPAEKGETVERIRASGAAITFVGLGCPRQEVFAYEWRDSLAMPIIAVGAAFDYFAGGLHEPPALAQSLGLQWLFRLVEEPRRLWRRYLLLNPAFLTLLFLQAAGLRRFDPSDVAQPSQELLYG